jgi:hypothetical protein
MIRIPESAFKLLVAGLLAIVVLSMLGDYTLAMMARSPLAPGANLGHAALCGLIGLLVAPVSSSAEVPMATKPESASAR